MYESSGFLGTGAHSRFSVPRCPPPLLALIGGRLPATEEVDAADNRLQRALDDLVDAAGGLEAGSRESGDTFTKMATPCTILSPGGRRPSTRGRMVITPVRAFPSRA
ncbi:hypothetical protein [Streptomyces sp. LMG1-1-1.1]|uniref:hypothetical protein n=1 Tax=Streptomyces sp. LMG1-1-1.1 TaxID=3135245 RepID=UPI0034669EA2